MNVKKIFSSTLLLAGLMLTALTSCETEDEKTEKKLDGLWKVESMDVFYSIGDSVVTDTTYTGSYNPSNIASVYIKEEDRSILVDMYGGNAMSGTYQVFGKDLFIKIEEYPQVMMFTLESIDKTSATLVNVSEYMDYDKYDFETDEPIWEKFVRKETIHLKK